MPRKTTHADPTCNGRYVVRALHADEQDAWLDLLAAAFATKGVPRSFFEGGSQSFFC